MKGQKLKRNILILSSTLSGFLFTVLLVMLIFDFNHSTFKLSKLNKYIKNEDNYLSVSKYYNLEIKTTEDTLKINITNDTESDSLVGNLSNNILTFTIPKKDKNIILKEKYKKTLNKNLNIKSEDLAIIPTEYKTEILCYEFKGTVDNREFIVYINAKTGEEEDILVIYNTPNGVLTM